MVFADHLAATTLTSLDELADRVNREQDTYLWITPPDPKHILRQPVGVIAFSWKEFPEDFIRSLVPSTQRGCPVYTVTLIEDFCTRDLTVQGSDGKAIYAIHSYEGYNPYRVLTRLYPDLSAGRYPPAYAAWLKACYDPGRVEIVVQLLPSEWIELYAANSYPTVAKKAVGVLSLSNGMKLMRSQAAQSNLVVDAVTYTPTGVVVEIGHPDTFTGRVDVYRCVDMAASNWVVAVTNLATNGTGTIYWTDPTATNESAPIGFFRAANGSIDNDQDGIGDARETLIYHSSATNRDSDCDGLVDGYSGVVATNVYPAGATTNGGHYVEGELAWHTDAMLRDTDDDGVEDGWEVGHGHNPTNWNDPPNVRGIVSYVGHQTGAVWVVAVTTSNSCATNASAVLTAPGGYRIPHLEATNYWLKAWVDSNGSGTTNATEARGTYAATALVITNRVLGIDFALTDPDNNANNLPDYWEMAHFGNTTNAATSDPDGDQYTNLEEYEAGTDPTNTLSHPWNISGTISYAGPQTGAVIIAACTNATGWGHVHALTNTAPGAYTITHLPPGTSYWIRAWRDSDSNGTATAWEAQGSPASNPVQLTTNATGIDVTLTDPDRDNDGLADWWEVKYGLSTNHIDRTQALGWWALDETSGTNVSDSSVHTNHGILQNAGTNGAWGTGVIGGALTFDGTNDTVEVFDSASLRPTSVSVALWVRPSRTYTNGSGAFFSKRMTAGTTGYSIGYENGALAFTICSSGAKTLRYPCALTNGVWLHVAGTYAESSLHLYLNGTEVLATNYVSVMSFGEIDQGAVSARLGATPDATPTNILAGTLDDILIFGGAVASNTIHDLCDLGADPDHDGLSNWEEYQAGTSPTSSDSDLDGMPDGWETQYGTGATVSNATGDADGDGYLNIYEYVRGSNPVSTNSIPLPTHVVTNGVSTIQATINSVTQDFAIVQVKAGTYTGSGNRAIDFGGKKLMLVSESGASNTIIDCQYAGRGFAFHSNEDLCSVLRGITVMRGESSVGGGILCSNASPWIRECAIVSNTPPYTINAYNAGGGIALIGSHARVTACRIADNGICSWNPGFIVSQGGGIHVLGGAPLISNTMIEANNSWDEGGGIWTGDATGEVVACTIVRNTSYTSGGGVCAYDGSRIVDCVIQSNVVGSLGGGVTCYGSVHLEGDTIQANSATGTESTAGVGGGIYAASANGKTPSFETLEIDGNNAEWSGGGMYLDLSTFATTVACRVVGNVSGNEGGGIFSFTGVTILGGEISSNSANHDGGGVKVYLYGTGGSRRTVMDGVTVRGNQAISYGGGVRIWDADGAGMTVLVTNCIVESNLAYIGGGLSVAGGAPLGNVAVADSVMSGNTATESGGGLQIGGGMHPSIVGCRIEGNGARVAAGIDNDTYTMLISRCMIVSNVAQDAVGGLCAANVCVLTMESSACLDNRAGFDVGGILCRTGTIQNCVIANNLASNNVVASGVYASGNQSPTVLRNTILWGNTGSQIGGMAQASYSCVQGGYSAYGSSNIITNNPLLYRDGYHLLSTNSPCWNTGSTNAPVVDMDGEPRPSPGGGVDIGADELKDTDGDGLPDWWHLRYFGDPTGAVASVDSDGDELTNGQEYEFGSDPTSNVDTDLDSLSDDLEAYIGTNPTYWDTDNDGLSDHWEHEYGFNPVFSNNPSLNSDDDDWTDGQEADQGTDPLLGDTDGDGVEDSLDADPLDPENAEVATPENSCNVTMMVGDSSGSHTELYGMQLGSFRLFMSSVSGNDFIFTKTIQLPRGHTYEGYIEAIGDDDNDGDYDANVTSEEPGVGVSDPNGYLGGHHEDTGFNSGRRYFQVVLGGVAANTNVAANADPENGCTIDPINTQNGNVTHSETDVVVPCPGLSLAFGRYYNSRSAVTNGSLGPCWAHAYETFLQQRNGATYKGTSGNWRILSLPEGQEFWFQDNGDGTYRNPPDSNLRLDAAGSGWVVTQAGGTRWTFDANGVLTGIADVFSNRVTLTYAGAFPAQRLTRVEHLNGQFLALSYAGTQLTRIDTPVGALSVEFTYNANGELAGAVRNAGGAAYTNRYFYDAGTHSLTQRVNAAGDRFDYGYEYTNLAGQVVSRGISMTLEPDYYRHAVNYTNRGANATEVTYTRNGVAQTFVYKFDPVINAIKAQLGPGGTNLGVRYTIDGKRDITQETQFDDSLGQYAKVLRSYDTNHNMTFEGFALNATSTTNWTAYTWSNNLPASVKDAEGALVEFEYTNGLLKTARMYGESNVVFATSCDYTTNGLLSAVTNANGHWQRFAYDAYGFMTSAVPQVGPATRFEPNHLGFVTNIVMPWSSGTRATRFGVTELGWVTNVVYPDGLGESFQFDVLGNLTNHVDRAGRTNRLTWLPTGKPASISRFLQQGTTNQEVRTAFSYDNQFNTLTITDPMGRPVERYAMDLQDRPVAVTNLEGQVMTINWGVGDYVRSITRFDGSVVSNSYDSAGLLAKVTGPGFTNSFTYRRNGAVSGASNTVGVVSNGFDGANRLTRETQQLKPFSTIVNYGLDSIGQATNVVLAVGTVAVTNRTTFDAAERLSCRTTPAGQFQYVYDLTNGLVASVSNLAAGIRVAYGFDVMDRVTNIVWRNATGGVLRAFAYRYSAAGMITNVAREAAAESVGYGVDSLDRITSASASYLTASYTWDLAGNPTRRVENGVTNNCALTNGNQLASWSGGTNRFDASGNVTNIVRGGVNWGLIWNGQYQLSEVRSNNVAVERYGYDALGRRSWTWDGTATNYHLYSGIHVMADVNATGGLIRTYSYSAGIDNLLAITVHTGAVAKTYYCMTDLAGTVHALADNTGAIVESYRFDPWGRVLGVWNGAGQAIAASAVGNRYLLQGREYSFKTGLYYFRARYLDPQTARFLSRDPFGISAGHNLYAAMNCNLASFRDPHGLYSFADVWVVVGSEEPATTRQVFRELARYAKSLKNYGKVRDFLTAEFDYDLDEALTEGGRGPGIVQFRRSGDADYCSKNKTASLDLYEGRALGEPFSAYADSWKTRLAANLLHEIAHHARDISGNKGWVPKGPRSKQMVATLAGPADKTDIPAGLYEGYFVNLLIGIR